MIYLVKLLETDKGIKIVAAFMAGVFSLILFTMIENGIKF